MIKLSKNIKTNKNKCWPYDEYNSCGTKFPTKSTYEGETHWTSAKSLESYLGSFLQSMMHGHGEYRWRHYADEGTPSTYEGYFYANQMHGYGTYSYADATVFCGLFYNNHRWGPGIEMCPNLSTNVGLWWGNQLIRLVWSPPTASVIPNLNNSPMAARLISKHRIKLEAVENESEVGLIEQWRKNILLTRDTKSDFNRNYYGGNKKSLKALDNFENDNDENNVKRPLFNAWNNSCIMIELMRHCYETDRQRESVGINLEQILSGPRRHFKSAATHELNCRTLLMASFLGHTAVVAQLINDYNVHPNVADVFGNTALMYAVSGDKTETIVFLIEAGAQVNDYNDSCCTALSIALIHFVAVTKNINVVNIVDFLTPSINIVENVVDNARDWNLNRSQSKDMVTAPSSNAKINNKKVKSAMSMKSTSSIKKKSIDEYDIKLNSIENTLHKIIAQEYLIRVSDIFGSIEQSKPENIFECTNMIQIIKDVDIIKNYIPIKNVSSKATKDTVLQDNIINRYQISETSIDSHKTGALAKIKQTILELLEKGANPKTVIYPLPALIMAVIGNDADLIKYLLKYGADIDETCPEMLNYTALEYAISRKLTESNLEVIKSLLENGAKADACLHYDESTYENEPKPLTGPTLLHAVLAKTVESDLETNVQRKLLDLLLDYGSDPTKLFKGQSALDVVITKQIDLLEVFMKNPKVNLNAVIDEANNTLLSKIINFDFYRLMDKSTFQDVMLWNLLQCGADPKIKLNINSENYENIFVFIKKQLMEIENSSPSPKTDAKNKTKQNGISKKSTTLLKNFEDDVEEYKKTLDIISEFSRNAHKQWLQSNLTMELMEIVKKFKHRSWHMIIKEHRRQKQVRLWLTAQRCLEIWSILAEHKRIGNDRKVLELLMCIVHYYNVQDKSKKLTFAEKTQIESNVKIMIQNFVYEETSRRIVKPELEYKKNKFNLLCFECSLPLNDTGIQCPFCKLVSFCQVECIKTNIDRPSCHPCSYRFTERVLDNLVK